MTIVPREKGVYIMVASVVDDDATNSHPYE
jgi:hypothetical protein